MPSNKTKIAINGFGRIGRSVFRAIQKNPEFKNLKVMAVNDLANKESLEYLLQHDSVYGLTDLSLKNVQFSQEPKPAKLPWQDIDVIIESTGHFTNFKDAAQHQGKKVVISAPCKSSSKNHFIYGVNHQDYQGQRVVSAGSCTTVALAHLVKNLDDSFGLESGLATTIHSYTTSQKILDLPHKDARRGRAAALSLIPTTTGSAKSVAKVLPHLQGKLDAIAVRVPTPVVSLIDFVGTLQKTTNSKEANNCFEYKAKKPRVSVDYRLDPRPVIIDPDFTRVQENLVKVLGWYDNEYGYSVQLVKLIKEIIK